MTISWDKGCATKRSRKVGKESSIILREAIITQKYYTLGSTELSIITISGRIFR